MLVDQWLSVFSEADLSDIDADEVVSFSGRLRESKRASIKRSVRAVVSQHAPGRADDTTNEDFAASCYDARSALVHGSIRVPDVGPMTSRLRKIVAAVIRGVAER